jgi:5'-nucleotidase
MKKIIAASQENYRPASHAFFSQQRHSAELRALHGRYHPVWGQILKTGYQNSRFAHQVTRDNSGVYNLSCSRLVKSFWLWQARLMAVGTLCALRYIHPQIERFACLYTSHVSNLCFASPNKRWIGRLDYMAHGARDVDANTLYLAHGCT